MRTWKGDLAFNTTTFAFPAVICCQKYPNGLCDIHISCLCENYIAENRTDERVWSLKQLYTACGCNNLIWEPEQTVVHVYTDEDAAKGINNKYLYAGRTGYMVKKYGADSFLLGRVYNTVMDFGGWSGDSAGTVYAKMAYYQMHIYGAKYN